MCNALHRTKLASKQLIVEPAHKAAVPPSDRAAAAEAAPHNTEAFMPSEPNVADFPAQKLSPQQPQTVPIRLLENSAASPLHPVPDLLSLSLGDPAIVSVQNTPGNAATDNSTPRGSHPRKPGGDVVVQDGWSKQSPQQMNSPTGTAGELDNVSLSTV